MRLLEAGHDFHLDRTFRRRVLGFMANERPLTIEILALVPGGPPLVVDRVTGGTNYFDEAKRIGEHLLSRTELDAGYGGYRILNSDLQVLYTWPSGDHATTPK